ncbi:hypothetical protein T492DRAFT_836859 [Pavlovales sp. CCMP2436]|nr:hypothetical protein T492DRAFT_836859 [Pavlovales sp. CCMP2436]
MGNLTHRVGLRALVALVGVVAVVQLAELSSRYVSYAGNSREAAARGDSAAARLDAPAAATVHARAVGGHAAPANGGDRAGPEARVQPGSEGTRTAPAAAGAQGARDGGGIASPGSELTSSPGSQHVADAEDDPPDANTADVGEADSLVGAGNPEMTGTSRAHGAGTGQGGVTESAGEADSGRDARVELVLAADGVTEGGGARAGFGRGGAGGSTRRAGKPVARTADEVVVAAATGGVVEKGSTLIDGMAAGRVVPGRSKESPGKSPGIWKVPGRIKENPGGNPPDNRQSGSDATRTQPRRAPQGQAGLNF